MRRSGSHNEVDLIESKKTLCTLRDVDVTEVDGIESSAEYSQSSLSQIGFPPQSGRLILAHTGATRWAFVRTILTTRRAPTLCASRDVGTASRALLRGAEGPRHGDRLAAAARRAAPLRCAFVSG